jgi:hypothetical protein
MSLTDTHCCNAIDKHTLYEFNGSAGISIVDENLHPALQMIIHQFSTDLKHSSSLLTSHQKDFQEGFIIQGVFSKCCKYSEIKSQDIHNHVPVRLVKNNSHWHLQRNQKQTV